MNIKDLKCIVTGGARGLGKCFVIELARQGAQVVTGDIDEDGLLDVEEETKELPGNVTSFPLDVANEDTVKTFVEKAFEETGGINALVNNAGVLRDGLLVKKEDGWIRKLPTVQWKAVLDINLSGPFYMAREVSLKMLEANICPGLIVNISSVTRSGNPGQSNYSASKAGLDADTRTWALELAPHGIRVGGIAPGVVDTPILENMDEKHQTELFSKIPVGRIGTPFEIWLALKFIIECDYFTGRIVDVDGGANF